MESINDRMETPVNERFGGNKAAFAVALGMGPTIMSSYLGEKRRSKPSVDMVAKIVKTLDVDARWLLIGEHGDCAPVLQGLDDVLHGPLSGIIAWFTARSHDMASR